MQEPNTDPAEAVTNAFEGVQFSVAFRAEPDEILTAVKAYANCPGRLRGMNAHSIRALLDSVDLEDNHEFATAYVRYVETTGVRPPLTEAIARFSTTGSI